jgi:hypothetical protein
MISVKLQLIISLLVEGKKHFYSFFIDFSSRWQSAMIGDGRKKQTFLFPAMSSPMIGDDHGQSAI